MLAVLGLSGCIGGGPAELRRLVETSSERVQCDAAEARASEHDGHYEIDACGYRFEYRCYNDSQLYRLGERECDETTPPHWAAEQALLTARRVIAAEGACPLAALTADWAELGAERGVVQVVGCDLRARLDCSLQAQRLTQCARLSFSDESQRDNLIVARAAFAAGHGCPAAEVAPVARGWSMLAGTPPRWSIFVKGCGQESGYVCDRHDPARGAVAACHEVALDAARVARAADTARRVAARAGGCPFESTAAQAVRSGDDPTPRQQVWVDVSGCASATLYGCTFDDLVAETPSCQPLEVAAHPALVSALDAALAAEGAKLEPRCDRDVELIARDGGDYSILLSSCEASLAYACRYDAAHDVAGCVPDADSRRRRGETITALRRDFARETACPDREVRITSRRPARVKGGGWAFAVAGCAVTRQVDCAGPGECAVRK